MEDSDSIPKWAIYIAVGFISLQGCCARPINYNPLERTTIEVKRIQTNRPMNIEDKTLENNKPLYWDNKKQETRPKNDNDNHPSRWHQQLRAKYV